MDKFMEDQLTLMIAWQSGPDKDHLIIVVNETLNVRIYNAALAQN